MIVRDRSSRHSRCERLSWVVAWFLQQAGYGDEPMALYKLAEYAVEAALTLAHESGEWLLADEALPAFKKLLALHDSQLAVAPLHKVTLFFS